MSPSPLNNTDPKSTLATLTQQYLDRILDGYPELLTKWRDPESGYLKYFKECYADISHNGEFDAELVTRILKLAMLTTPPCNISHDVGSSAGDLYQKCEYHYRKMYDACCEKILPYKDSLPTVDQAIELTETGFKRFAGMPYDGSLDEFVRKLLFFSECLNFLSKPTPQ